MCVCREGGGQYWESTGYEINRFLVHADTGDGGMLTALTFRILWRLGTRLRRLQSGFTTTTGVRILDELSANKPLFFSDVCIRSIDGKS